VTVTSGEVAFIYFVVLGINSILQGELFADLIINELK